MNNVSGTYDGVPFNNVNVTTLTFESITSANESFTDKLLLTSLTIGDGVVLIDDNAFAGCTYLTGSLTIPSSVTEIGVSAFQNCGLTGPLVMLGTALLSINDDAFNGCTKLTSELTIPSSVTKIGRYAFSFCQNLTGLLTLPTSVTEIEYGAFSNCIGITSFNLQSCNVLKIIGEINNGENIGAFESCINLTGDLIIPSSVTELGRYTFYDCGFNGTLTFANGSTLDTLYDFVFGSSNFQTPIIIPSHIITINDNAFANFYEPNSNQQISMHYDTFNNVDTQGDVELNENNYNDDNTTAIKYTFATRIGLASGSQVTISCFAENTMILCMNDKYIPIKNLTKNSFIKTLDGTNVRVKYILTNKFTNGSNVLTHNMYKMKNSDLTITGGHSILVDELTETQKELQKQFWGDAVYKINDKFLLLSCCSEQFEKINDTNEYTYYHIVLENNNDVGKQYGIWADGVLTETLSERVYLSYFN
jgi:hypothetical protein